MALTINDSTTELKPIVNATYKETYLRNAKSRCLHFQGTEPAEVMENRGSRTCNWQRIENLASASIQASGTDVPTYATLTELTGNAAYGQGRSAATLTVNQKTATATDRKSTRLNSRH